MKINLTAGYNQVWIRPKDKPKSTFCCKYGAFESLVMNFGMMNTPPTFVSLMNTIFKEAIGKIVVVYLDNIIVYSPNEDQHLLDLKKVLNILRYNNLYAKPSKCEFFK